MIENYQLIPATRDRWTWEAYHSIRKAELWTSRGHEGYHPDHPDETRPGHHPLLLLWGEQAIGVARLDELGQGKGAVRRVAISGAFQRQGHGRVLSQLIEQRARNLGITVLLVNAAADARGYYESLGWEPFAWNSQIPSGGRWPVVQMQKILIP